MQNTTFHKTTLANGVRVLARQDSRFPSAIFAINIVSGLRDEDPAQAGLTHFLEHMLFRRTQNKSAKQIANTIDSLGGDVNAFTDLDSLTLHGEVPTAHFAELCEFLSELLLEPVFTSSDFELEKEVIRQEILEALDNPADLVNMRYQALFWRDHILAKPVFGTLETLDNLSLEDIKDRYQQIVKGSRIVIACCGNYDEKYLHGFLEKKFANLDSGELVTYQKTKPALCGIDFVQRDSQQIHIALGTTWLEFGHPHYELAKLVSAALGGGVSSRLFQKLREEHGLAYDVALFNDSYPDAGQMTICAALEKANLDQALALIFEELDDVSESLLSAEEFERTRSMILAQLEMGKSDIDNLLWHAVESELNLKKPISIEEIVERYRTLEFSALAPFVESWLKDKKYILVLGGDLKDYQVPESIRERCA